MAKARISKARGASRPRVSTGIASAKQQAARRRNAGKAALARFGVSRGERKKTYRGRPR